MENWSYKRVTRKRVCSVCGKPDWCSYTPHEKISFCARVTDGADKISRHDWGIFYHDKSLLNRKPVPFPAELPPKPELMPLEIRHFVYQKLIELSPASNYNEIINGEKGLRERKILDFENYGSLPLLSFERRRLAKKIRNLINQNFSEYVRAKGNSISGLPGFWLDKRENIRLWFDRNYFCPLLLIPYRNENGMIQACQIRFMRKSVGNGTRYLWLSIPEKNKISCGTPLHFAHNSSNRKPEDSDAVIVTEGALKAQTVQIFNPELQVIANSGVSCAHKEIIEAARYKALFIGFDSDYHENPQVIRHLARLIRARIEDSQKHGYQGETKILVWNLIYKGIDDALLNHQQIKSMSLSEWLQSLESECRRDALKVLELSEKSAAETNFQKITTFSAC